MKKKVIISSVLITSILIIFGVILLVYIFGNLKEKQKDLHLMNNYTKLSIDKEYNIKGLNSITYDGADLWGLAGNPAYSGVEYQKRIVQIDKNNGQIKSECSINFTGMGIAFIENSFWITTDENKIYKINPDICKEKNECSKENNCIFDSINLTENNLKGITFDEEYLYIINRNPMSDTKISKYTLKGEFINNTLINRRDIEDVSWDGKYFWTIDSVFMMGIPEAPIPPSHIRAYDKKWKEVFYQAFEINTPVWYGITYDGENLWVADGYHDKIYKISINRRIL